MSNHHPGDLVNVAPLLAESTWVVHKVEDDVLTLYATGFRITPAEMKVLSSHVRPAQMEEPTKFGAMVQTDDGPAVRRTSDQSFPVPWFVEGYLNAFRSFHWSSLRNPRPYTGGDDD